MLLGDVFDAMEIGKLVATPPDRVRAGARGELSLRFRWEHEPGPDAPYPSLVPVHAFYRPPLPITATIEPGPFAPPEDVLTCLVASDPIEDDPDYDVLSYHYVWTVDGNVVRDVVTAAWTDNLPRKTAAAGEIVTCTLTPSDEALEAPSVKARVLVGQGPPRRSAGGRLPKPAMR